VVEAPIAGVAVLVAVLAVVFAVVSDVHKAVALELIVVEHLTVVVACQLLGLVH
jgi:hypothetical protein